MYLYSSIQDSAEKFILYSLYMNNIEMYLMMIKVSGSLQGLNKFKALKS